MIQIVSQLWYSRKGATAIEYGLVVGLIAVSAMVAIANVADTTSGMWDHVEDSVVSASAQEE
ncbi:Flp family type IVb pilin [Alterisphingorhabdus coralli]|uniref:Flp family type IVb pilin n=1 Tax=Alterisphingorhabdus coralli TaxID=3071408 RepID=A0AA97F505_9SPHN|nr:Flp family type IVb pilin [Parasphingorhabdus sp. SCSIO 66989]WOE74131.1 Flp family type IVb pilin [Parasphingorhabdus sp. SCSIO 66989]